MGLPALDVFPRKLWSRLAARRARSLSLSKMTYQEPSGFAPLRQAIANHLAIGRRLCCSEHQIFVTAGFLGALSLIGRTLVSPGDKVWMEDPGFPPARQALQLCGAELVPVPVDRAGMDVSAALDLAPFARLALVKPAVQFPLGCSLSAARRSALLSWARETGAWVVEDDYDGELSRGDALPPMLQDAGAAGRVLHAGSFSNVLFPGLRLGYLVAPASLVPHLERTAALLPMQQSLLDQTIVCDFIGEGHFARHLARMRSLYAERRGALAAALNEVLGDFASVDEAAGTHLLLRLRQHGDDVEIARLARTQGLAVNALSAMAVRARTGPGLLLGFTNILPEAAKDAAQRLRNVLQLQPPGVPAASSDLAESDAPAAIGLVG
jgi:GntR family transcriptional regulator/MocR family aminotransferase